MDEWCDFTKLSKVRVAVVFVIIGDIATNKRRSQGKATAKKRHKKGETKINKNFILKNEIAMDMCEFRINSTNFQSKRIIIYEFGWQTRKTIQ